MSSNVYTPTAGANTNENKNANIDRDIGTDKQEAIDNAGSTDSDENNQANNSRNKIYNLSVKDIGDNLSKTVIDMLNEFSLYRNDENKRWQDYVRIITNEDRLIYVGIMFVVVSLIVFFIDVSR